MSDSVPGFKAIKETEEIQIWGSGPDNQHRRYHGKVDIKSTVTDTGNTNNTTTLRGGFLLGIKDSDGMAYAYDVDANDGTQVPVGVLEKHMSMLDRDGTVEDKFKAILLGGLLSNPSSDLVGFDKVAAAALLRRGFNFMGVDPHGSAFLIHPKRRDFKAADYTVLDADHGKQLIATAACNFTLPSLATVGAGFEVWLFMAANANMIVTGAADTIVYDDTTNGKATTLTWSTASQKMGASVLMRSDYDGAAGTLSWYPLMIQRTVVAA